MGDVTYTVIRPAGGGPESGQGGIVGISDEQWAAGMKPRWQPYFEVTDCDAVAATAAERGGTAPMAPESVEGVGRWALLTDPFGATFAVITSEPA
jgi:predicted enzyme related to lactoylglutathione lyase